MLFFGSAPGGSAASICLLLPFRSEVEQSGKRGMSPELLCFHAPFCLPLCPSVRPSQASAGVGLQLDDPLPSMVTVVKVQEVRVGIQTVFTYKKNQLLTRAALITVLQQNNQEKKKNN